MVLGMLSRFNAFAQRRMGGRPGWYEAGDVRLRYHEFGPPDGEPWLLLHGLAALGGSWTAVIRKLSTECRLVVPELSALGGSEAPGGALSLDAAPEVLDGFIRSVLGDRPVTLAGISLGGWMAVNLTRAHPERVARLVLVDAGGYRDQDWDFIERRVRVKSPEDVGPLLDVLYRRVTRPVRLFKPLFYRVFASPEIRGLLDGIEERHTFCADDLARVRVPSLVVWASHDVLFPLDVGRQIAAALPESELLVVEGSGHAVHLERPRAFARAVVQGRHDLPLTSP